MDAGRLMGQDIDDQPGVLAALLGTVGEIERVAAAVASRGPRFVLLAARGTSDHAALYGKYLVEIELRRPAGLASPSTLTVYAARPDLTGVLMIAVSQSGASPDLVESVQAARECGAVTVAVTNNAGSALAAAAELHVDIGAGSERAVAATKTYTAELLALHLLLLGIRDGSCSAARERAAPLPDLAAQVLA
ncbi:MAG: SIS domain-containing protein, partial [Mycobacteriales bacterium]